jgi:hypothetical protein
MSLGYPHCNVAEMAEYFAVHGTTAGCEVVEFEDVADLDAACEADGSGPPPAVPFARWIADQAEHFRRQDTAAGRWLAAELTELADLARALCATGPEELDDRREALDRSMRETSFEALMAASD